MCVISSRCRDELWKHTHRLNSTKDPLYSCRFTYYSLCICIVFDAKSDTRKSLIRCMNCSCCRMVTRSLRANVLTSSQQRADDSGMAWRSRGQRHLPVPAASSSGEQVLALFEKTPTFCTNVRTCTMNQA